MFRSLNEKNHHRVSQTQKFTHIGTNLISFSSQDKWGQAQLRIQSTKIINSSPAKSTPFLLSKSDPILSRNNF